MSSESCQFQCSDKGPTTVKLAIKVEGRGRKVQQTQNGSTGESKCMQENNIFSLSLFCFFCFFLVFFFFGFLVPIGSYQTSSFRWFLCWAYTKGAGRFPRLHRYLLFSLRSQSSLPSSTFSSTTLGFLVSGGDITSLLVHPHQFGKLLLCLGFLRIVFSPRSPILR